MARAPPTDYVLLLLNSKKNCYCKNVKVGAQTTALPAVAVTAVHP